MWHLKFIITTKLYTGCTLFTDILRQIDKCYHRTSKQNIDIHTHSYQESVPLFYGCFSCFILNSNKLKNMFSVDILFLSKHKFNLLFIFIIDFKKMLATNVRLIKAYQKFVSRSESKFFVAVFKVFLGWGHRVLNYRRLTYTLLLLHQVLQLSRESFRPFF